MLRNTREVNQVALLRSAQQALGDNTDNLNSQEWITLRNILADGLDTNILFLNWCEREELIQLMEAGQMSNSRAESLAIRGGRITTVDGNENFIVGGNCGNDFRPSRQNQE